MIKLNGITKKYIGDTYETIALNDISLEINNGDFACIMGKSGSGKSTLLHIIGCLDTPDKGEYYLDDVCVTKLPIYKFDHIRKEKISCVFQNYELMNKYTVWENIEMPLNARKIRGQEKKKRINDILEKLEIEKLKNKFPEQISGGEQQRTAIARACVMDTPYIVADEPTGALDEENTVHLMNMFKEINKSGKTIILVTHDPDVAAYGDYVVNLKDGRIV